MAGPVKAQDIEPEEVDWLWPIGSGSDLGRIPRSCLTVIAGRPDQGKGLVVTKIGADVANAGGHVLHSAIEDSPGLITRPRYEAAGADLSRVHLWRFLMPAQLRELQAIVVKKQIDLIVIDPVAAHLTGGISRHSDSIRMVLNPLTELAESTGCAIVFIDHALKRVQQSGHPLDCIGGSGSGLPAACRSAYVFGSTPEDDDGRYLSTVKMNLREWSKTEAMRFEMDTAKCEPSGIVAPYLMLDDADADLDPMRLFEKKAKTNRVGRPPDKRAAACEWLATYLMAAGQPVLGSTVFEGRQAVRDDVQDASPSRPGDGCHQDAARRRAELHVGPAGRGEGCACAGEGRGEGWRGGQGGRRCRR